MIDKIKRRLMEYFEFEGVSRSIRFLAPAGFTGQGCLWYSDTAPEGWLLCDGTQVSKEKYPALWLLLGTTWGAATSTLFTLPDLRQRVPVGKHSSGTFNALNNSGGTETHTLTVAEMPAHDHSYVLATPVGGAATGGGPGNKINTSNSTTGSAGGGGSHNNLQPYRVVNFIIKT